MLKLTDKVDYVIDGEMLDWFSDHGLKLEDITIKQKLEYNKSEWLEPYIGDGGRWRATVLVVMVTVPSYW